MESFLLQNWKMISIIIKKMKIKGNRISFASRLLFLQHPQHITFYVEARLLMPPD